MTTPSFSLPTLATADSPYGRFASRVVLFCVVFTTLVLGLEVLVRATFADDVALKYRELFAGTTDHPGVLLGASVAAHGVDPGVLDESGVSFYNFALDGAGPVFQEAFYDRYRATGRRPKVVLYNADWYMFGAAPERHFEQDCAYFPLPVYGSLLADRHHDTKLLLFNRLMLVKDRWDIPFMLATGTRPGQAFRPEMKSFRRGWAPLVGGGIHGERGMAPALVVVPAKLAAFERLAARMKREGTRLVLFQAPMVAPVPAAVLDANRQMAAIATRLGLPFLDYNGQRQSELNTNRALFFDYAHLNEAGSQAFSRRLAWDLNSLLPVGQ